MMLLAFVNYSRAIAGVILAASLALSPLAMARGGGGSHKSYSGSHTSGSRSSHAPRPHSSNAKLSTPRAKHSTPQTTGRSSNHAQGVKRDSHGKIARSQMAKNDFKKSHPCPSTGKSSGACKGYVIDHVKPLKRGGADAPNNMQWQTKGAAKQKDKVE